MSLKIINLVERKTTVAKSQYHLLVAMASFANPAGIAATSTDRLAARAGFSLKYTRHLLNELKHAGEILVFDRSEYPSTSDPSISGSPRVYYIACGRKRERISRALLADPRLQLTEEEVHAAIDVLESNRRAFKATGANLNNGKKRPVGRRNSSGQGWSQKPQIQKPQMQKRATQKDRTQTANLTQNASNSGLKRLQYGGRATHPAYPDSSHRTLADPSSSISIAAGNGIPPLLDPSLGAYFMFQGAGENVWHTAAWHEKVEREKVELEEVWQQNMWHEDVLHDVFPHEAENFQDVDAARKYPCSTQPSQRCYPIYIDEECFVLIAPVVFGWQLLKMASRDPYWDEIVQLIPYGNNRRIAPEVAVDLQGIEGPKFITLERERAGSPRL